MNPASIEAVILPQDVASAWLDESRAAARVLALLEAELRAADEFGPAELQVAQLFENLGIPIDRENRNQNLEPTKETIESFLQFLTELGLIDLLERASDVTSIYNVDEDPSRVRLAPPARPKESMVAILGSVLEDQFIVEEEFHFAKPTGFYAEYHADPAVVSDVGTSTFHQVVTLERFNACMASRHARGFSDPANKPYTLRPKTAFGSDVYDRMPARPPDAQAIVYDSELSGYNRAWLNRRPTTFSHWPRVQVGRLCGRYAINLAQVVATNLEHYSDKGCCLLFHGTLGGQADSIVRGLRFDLTRPGYDRLGNGLYASSNINESKGYALLRYRQARERQERRAGAGSSSADAAEAADLASTIAIVVLLVRKADTVLRVEKDNADVQNGCTFVLHDGAKLGNQVALHGGTKDLIKVVGIHQIQLSDRIEHTTCNDAAHNALLGWRTASLTPPPA